MRHSAATAALTALVVSLHATPCESFLASDSVLAPTVRTKNQERSGSTKKASWRAFALTHVSNLHTNANEKVARGESSVVAISASSSDNGNDDGNSNGLAKAVVHALSLRGGGFNSASRRPGQHPQSPSTAATPKATTASPSPSSLNLLKQADRDDVSQASKAADAGVSIGSAKARLGSSVPANPSAPHHSPMLFYSASAQQHASQYLAVTGVPHGSEVHSRPKTQLYSSVLSPQAPTASPLRVPFPISNPRKRWSHASKPKHHRVPVPPLQPVDAQSDQQKHRQKQAQAETKDAGKASSRLSVFDVSVFLSYFCNVLVVSLPVVVVPAAAVEFMSTASAASRATFVATAAAASPLGGFIGKIVNGFVCQSLGGHRSSWMYMSVLSVLAFAMSLAPTIGWIAPLVLCYEFLSSIQWIAICQVIGNKHGNDAALISKGIASLGMASVTGALVSKIFGAAILRASNWRLLCRFGSGVAAVGALAMFVGCRTHPTSPQSKPVATAPPKKGNALASLRSILGHPLFWQLGIAHSVGYLIRGSDRLLAPFLEHATALPGDICATLTSSVTAGMFFGLIQGQKFSNMDNVRAKLRMLKQEYFKGAVSVAGLALCCGLNTIGLGAGAGGRMLLAAIIALLSGVAASAISFQFYQFPNLTASTLFPANSPIALSLFDAVAYLGTAQILSANSHILGNFGWSASWTFLAAVFAAGGSLMVRSIVPVLKKSLSDGVDANLDDRINDETMAPVAAAAAL